MVESAAGPGPEGAGQAPVARVRRAAAARVACGAAAAAGARRRLARDQAEAVAAEAAAAEAAAAAAARGERQLAAQRLDGAGLLRCILLVALAPGSGRGLVVRRGVGLGGD
jgi:hypothetical protein